MREILASRWKKSLLMALTLLLGSAGGVIAWKLKMPLAFMLGSMIAVTLAALVGMVASIPSGLREVMVAVLGVMLGSGFTPAILDHLAQWTISLALLIPYVFLSGGAIAFGLQRWTGMHRATAFFSAMPGGFNEMVAIGSAEGGDLRTLALIHASRIMLTVLILPLGFWLVYGNSSQTLAVGSHSWPAWRDLALLAGCVIVGMVGGRWLRLPAANLLGPLLLSAAIHLSGLTASSPPGLAIAIAQIIVGSAIGCRFTGATPMLLLRVIGLSVGITVVMLLSTLGFSWLVHGLTGIGMATVLLAYAPGGLAEMTLTALSLGSDTAYVSAHHLARIFIIVIGAHPLYLLLKRRSQGCAGGNGMAP